MNISVQKLPNCQAVLDVEIPSDLIENERKGILGAFSKQAKLPGFRPGKAPRAVIEKRFGSAITEELDGRLMDKAFREALQQDETLKVIDVKWPDALTHQPDGNARMTASLTLAPDFTLPEYKGIEIELPKSEVTDEMLESEVQRLREGQSEFSSIEDRAVAEDDLAIIDYSSSCEGKSLEEIAGKQVAQLEKGESYWVKIDEESFLPGFATQLVGMSPGDEREVTVTIQEDFPLEELRLKDIVFQVKLNEIKEQKLPTDDELVAKLMPNGSMDELREALQAQVQFQLTQQITQMKENTLLDKLANSVDFELPDDYVASETQSQTDQMVENAVRQGMAEDQLESQQEEIFEAAGQRARNNLKVQFLLSEIATAEKITVAEPEFLEHLKRLAERAKKPVKAYIKELQRNRRLDSIRNQLMIAKTIDFLLEHANVTEVEPTANDTESSDE